MLCCRSHIGLGQTINTILYNIVGLGLHFREEGVYYSLNLAHGLPLTIFCMTQNVALTAITSCFQLNIVITKFKSNLFQAISFSDPSIFVEKFIKTFATMYVGAQILYVIVIYTLNKRTEELSEANKKAEDALEQQKTFVYSFSHEMRNPMNSLLGNLDLALMAQVAPEIREMIATAKTCGVLLLNLINTVLDAGKLGLGRLEVNPVPTRIHDVLQRVWGISHDLITKKGLKGHLKISKKVPPRVMIDGHRINQVFMNLIGNAIKFTESGSITMTISWLEVGQKCFEPVPYDAESEGIFEKEENFYAIKRDNGDQENFILTGNVKEFNLEGVAQMLTETKGTLKVVIKDTGCGIRQEELSKLFQKFSQVGEDNSKKQKGTGLGLFISQEICNNLGGEIRAYSKPGKGTTFIVCIPCVGLPTMQLERCDEKFISRLKAKGLRTIIADDSPFNVTLVKNFYAKIGIDVLGLANNGLGAYKKYLKCVGEGRDVDIVTLDIDMPLMNGKEVCEKIREYEEKNEVKKPCVVILISGNYEEENVEKLWLDGGRRKADYFLKKPLVFEEFCWAIERAVVDRSRLY